MLSTDAKIRACFTSFLAARAPSRKADFSTLKCQLLTVRLSQDLVSVDIFESEDHLEHRIKIFSSLFVPSNASKGVKLPKFLYYYSNKNRYELCLKSHGAPDFWELAITCTPVTEVDVISEKVKLWGAGLGSMGILMRHESRPTWIK